MAPARTKCYRWPSLLAVVTLAVTAGCGDPLNPQPRARRTAVGIVRDGAHAAQQDLDRILRDPPSSTQKPSALADRIRSEMGSYGQARGQVVAVTADADRTVHEQMVFYGRAEDGGGSSYVSMTVRLCVALDGRAGPAASTELHDAPCPTVMPSGGPYVGTVDETVKLTG